MNTTSVSASPARRYDFDWLRVLAILAVFIFHSTRFFSIEDWHVKNPVTYAPVEAMQQFMNYWMMPLIFLVSGASLFFALKNASLSSAGKFLKDKVLRLFVPLAVNVFSLVILQVYFERVSHGQFTGSLIQFLPHYFEGVYGFGGNFAAVGNHLWYLAVLFLFCIVLLPVLMLLKTRRGAAILERITNVLSRFGLFYLLPLACTVLWKLIDEDGILGFDKFNWNLGVYISMVLVGYIFASNSRLMDSIKRYRWVSLALAAAVTVLLLRGEEHNDLILWTYVLTFLGFAAKYLNVETPFLKVASPAVLPFYILHQTVLLVIGFYVVQWNIADPVKWLIITAASLAVILAAYEYAVRRSNLLRVLFGMRPEKRAAQPAALPARGMPELG
jgi:peptidoglycan/LPS O-acetylase OafA/YrhL